VLFRARNRPRLIPRWFWLLLVFLPLGVMAWWFLRWFFLPSYQRISAVEIETPRSSGVPLPIQRDDFTVIKGIGPKTAASLYQESIFTYEQLGLMDPDKLQEILRDHSLPTSNAATWQEQAALAAAEDWDRLEEIQD